MEARTLTHSLASCSGLARMPTCSSSAARSPAALRAPRLALRVQQAQSLSRQNTAAAASSLLDAPTAEEMAGPVTMVHGPREFQDVLAANKDKLVVLMCKATHCRPCKLFSKKFAMAAMQYTDSVFLSIIGDENKETRGMMIENKIKVTPSFLIFRNGERVHSHGGVNETNLHRYVTKFLKPGEAGYGSFVEPAAGTEEAAEKK